MNNNITQDASLSEIEARIKQEGIVNLNIEQLNELKVVNENSEYPDIKELKSGEIRVLDTYKNLEWLLKHFGATVRHNKMTRKREINFPWLEIPKEDVENSSLAMVTHIATLNYMPIRQIDIHLSMIGWENAYHPIVDCMKDNPWDGISRFKEFAETLETTQPQIAEFLLKTWMVASMAAAHSEEGFMNHGVLVLHGKQRIGKTTWVMNLDPINCGAVKESAFLDPTNKDSVIQLNSFWISELAEVDAIFKKSEVGRLKAFITTKTDYVRNPYARKSTILPRRSTYVATVNVDSFLTDDTGNRRWWTLTVLSINNNHGLDMIQVWAEIYHLWKNGYPPYLDDVLEEVVDNLNRDYEKVDPMKEELLQFFDWDHPDRMEMTATAILKKMNYPKFGQCESTNMGKLLTEINQGTPRKSNGMKLHKVPCRLRPKE